MRNHYLEILELHPGATAKEVKTAYRRLSKKYHPDLNKSEKAKEQFIELTEAYNFLSKVGPNPHQEYISYDYDPRVSEYDLWRQRAREYARKRAREEARLQEEMTKKVLKAFNFAGLLILLFNVVLIVDARLPLVKHDQNILSHHFGHYYEIYFEEYTIRSEGGVLDKDELPRKGQVFATALLDAAMYATLEVNGKNRQYHQIVNVHRLSFIIYIIVIIAFFYQSIRNLDTKLTLAIAMVIFFLIQVVASIGS